MKTLFYIFLSLLLPSQLFAQADTVPPVIRCKSDNIKIPLSSYCEARVMPFKMIDTLYDDSPGQISLGIRKACAGEGFPKDTLVTYRHSEFLSPSAVEVWAKDAAGNISMQICKFSISGFPDCQYWPMYMSTTTPNLRRISDVSYICEATHCVFDSIKYEGVLNQGYTYEFPLPAGYSGHLSVSKNEGAAAGITTADLLLISQSLKGEPTLDTPYKIIAADADGNGAVNAYDIVTLRKLILGISETLPNETPVWRFIPKDYVFPNPNTPFGLPFPSSIAILPQTNPLESLFSFIGIKTGDVNESAILE